MTLSHVMSDIKGDMGMYLVLATFPSLLGPIYYLDIQVRPSKELCHRQFQDAPVLALPLVLIFQKRLPLLD